MYYYTMQIYLQDNSNLQTINEQVKQCNMLRYAAPLKETFKFPQRLSLESREFHRDTYSVRYKRKVIGISSGKRLVEWQGVRSNIIRIVPVTKYPRGEITQLVDDLVQ